jgi:hypothetical protein
MESSKHCHHHHLSVTHLRFLCSIIQIHISLFVFSLLYKGRDLSSLFTAACITTRIVLA